MNLSDFSTIQLKIKQISAKVQNKFNICKASLNEEQIKNAQDAMALLKSFDSNYTNLTEEKLNAGMNRVSTLITSAFSADVACPELREKGKQNMIDRVKQVTPRSIGSQLELASKYADNPTQTEGLKTSSAEPPSKVAEKILRDLKNRYYISAQDAFDGYTKSKNLWSFASNKQKVILGKLLETWGFVVDYSNIEKELEKDNKELEKKYENFAQTKVPEADTK